MRWRAAVLALACTACATGGDGSGGVGPVTIGSAVSTQASLGSSASGSSDGSESSGSSGGVCAGECAPGTIDTQQCPGMCATRERVCDGSCNFGPWGDCTPIDDACTPGETMSCGMCMVQTCEDDCQWGVCEETTCNFVCLHAARNGSEICDDEGFEMPAEGALYLVCEDANGGIGYVANNTGPKQKDGIPRCQGWEDMGLNAWDYLDYVVMMECDQAGKFLEIPLPPGTSSHFGVHDHPDGGGHLTQVCIATLQE